MTSIAKVMYFYIAFGKMLYEKSLYPTPISSDRESIQWHIISPSKRRTCLPPASFLSFDGARPWSKLEHIEELASAQRIVLRYTKSIEAHIGTASKTAMLRSSSGAESEVHYD